MYQDGTAVCTKKDNTCSHFHLRRCTGKDNLLSGRQLEGMFCVTHLLQLHRQRNWQSHFSEAALLHEGEVCSKWSEMSWSSLSRLSLSPFSMTLNTSKNSLRQDAAQHLYFEVDNPGDNLTGVLGTPREDWEPFISLVKARREGDGETDWEIERRRDRETGF